MRPQSFRLRGVRKRYREFTLGEIDLDLAPGATLGLIGPNGAGKSTLLRILLGLVRADGGRVEVLGRVMPADEREIKRRTAFVSEDMALYRGATLRWHMDLVRSFCPDWDERRAGELLERLGLQPHWKGRALSRGQQVKALLVLALARRPALLLLDEPLAGLDPLARHEVVRLLGAERASDCAVVFSSHHGREVAELAQEVAFLHGGKLLVHEPVSRVLRPGGSLEQAFLERVGAA